MGASAGRGDPDAAKHRNRLKCKINPTTQPFFRTGSAGLQIDCERRQVSTGPEGQRLRRMALVNICRGLRSQGTYAIRRISSSAIQTHTVEMHYNSITRLGVFYIERASQRIAVGLCVTNALVVESGGIDRPRDDHISGPYARKHRMPRGECVVVRLVLDSVDLGGRDRGGGKQLAHLRSLMCHWRYFAGIRNSRPAY